MTEHNHKICPNCNKKSLNWRKIDESYICYNCKSLFSDDLTEFPKGTFGDKQGNRFNIEIEKEPGIIRKITTYHLEPGKTTLKGEYPKLREQDQCCYPDRNSCNNEIGSKRCEHMIYEKRGWRCTFLSKSDYEIFKYKTI